MTLVSRTRTRTQDLRGAATATRPCARSSSGSSMRHTSTSFLEGGARPAAPQPAAAPRRRRVQQRSRRRRVDAGAEAATGRRAQGGAARALGDRGGEEGAGGERQGGAGAAAALAQRRRARASGRGRRHRPQDGAADREGGRAHPPTAVARLRCRRGKRRWSRRRRRVRRRRCCPTSPTADDNLGQVTPFAAFSPGSDVASRPPPRQLGERRRRSRLADKPGEASGGQRGGRTAETPPDALPNGLHAVRDRFDSEGKGVR